jgi:hypothetical protein
MKKISFFAAVISLLILAGCWKTVQTEDISTDTWAVWTGEFPLCANEQLVEIPILVIDNLVKNCTEKNKEWKFLDGLGWVYPMYVIANNQILLGSFNNEETGSAVVCQQRDEQKLIALDTYTLQGMDAIVRVIGKWYISNIVGKQYPDTIYCKDNDSDCADMLDYEWWTDGQNYFVAGYREPTNTNYSIVYVINDKVYNPGESKLGNWIMQQSKRNFAGTNENKIIVKRIKNGILIWDPETMTIDKLKSTYVLETCEMDL